MSYDGFGSNNAGSYEGFSSSQQGGGGNFASPSQGTRDQYGGGGGSGGAAAGGAKKRDPQSLTPVNCKQINEAVDKSGKYVMAATGAPLPQVKLIANVLSFTQKETHMEIQMEDGSGSTTVRMYLDQGAEAPQIREGSYFVVTGQIKKIAGAPCLSAFACTLLEDYNHLTMHSLEIIKHELIHTRGKLGAAPTQGQQQQQGQYQQQGRANSAAAAAGGYKQEQQGGNGAYMSDAVLPPGLHSTGDPIRDQVLAAFATGPDAGTDGGCSVTSVVQHLGHLSFLQVQAAIAALSNDGHLYSTVDEDH